jgi:hypothetical protein
MSKKEIELLSQLLNGNHLSSEDFLELEKFLKKVRKEVRNRLNVNK